MYLDNLTADGVSNSVELQDACDVCVSASGDFGTGTLTAQISADRGTSWVTFSYAGTDQTWTANDVKTYDIGGLWLRFSLASATNPDIDIVVSGKNVVRTDQ